MALSLVIRHHLIPAATRFFRRTNAISFVASIPVAALIGFAYWRYFSAIQQLAEAPLSLRDARLGALAGLAPVLLLRAPVTRGSSIFHSLAADPATSLKIVTLMNAGSRFPYALLPVLGAAPFVFRLSTSVEQALLHLIGDMTYVFVFSSAAVLIDAACIRRPPRRVLLALGVLALVCAWTLAPAHGPSAGIAVAAVNVMALSVCWTLVIPRMDPALVREYFNRRVTHDRGTRRLRRIIDLFGAETGVYLDSFVFTGASAIPLIAALAVYAYLVVFLVRGAPQAEPLSTVMALGFGAAFLHGSVLIESFRNFNLLFAKMQPVTFFRLTRLMLTPHCAVIGVAIAALVVLLALLGLMQPAPVLILMSFAVFLPALAWSIAMRFLRSRLLAGLYYAVLALGGVVLAVTVPAAYAPYAAATCAVAYRRGMRRFADLTAEDWE